MDRNFVTKFLKGSIASSIGQFATVLFHFLTISVLTRRVAVVEIGLYELMLAIAVGAKILGTLGLDLTLVQFLSSRPRRDQRYAFATVLSTRLVVMVILTILIYALGAFLLPLLSDDLVPYRWRFPWLLPTLFVIMSFRELFIFVLQGLQEFRALAIFQVLSAALKFILTFSLANFFYLNLTILLILEIVVMGSSLVYIIFQIPLRSYRFDRITLKLQSFRDVFKFGVPLYINSLVVFASNYGSTIIIAIFLTAADIAFFGVAGKLPTGIARLFASFRVVYFPTLSQLFSTGRTKDAATFMNKSLVLLGSLIFGGVIICLLFSEDIIWLFFGEAFLDIQFTFVLLITAVCFELLAGTMGYSLVSAGHPQKSTRVNTISIGILLVLYLILIPIMGYPGAAMAFFVSKIISQFLGYFALREIGVTINLTEYLKPFAFLGGIAALHYFLGIDSLLGEVGAITEYVYKAGLIGLYFLLCYSLIADCREAVSFLFKLTQGRRAQTTPA